MKITGKILREIGGIACDDNVSFEGMGMLNEQNIPNMLTWLYVEKYMHEAYDNPNISGVIITPELNEKFEKPGLVRFIVDDPGMIVYKLHDFVAKQEYKKWDSIIASTAKIHEQAYVSPFNVIIGEHTVVEAHASILADAEIGANCVIRSGARISSDNFNREFSAGGEVLGAFSSRKAILEDNVEVGSNSCIDKSDAYRDTIIGKGTKIHSQVQVCHGVNFGENCIVWGGVFFCGFVTVGNQVQFQPRALISNEINIGDKAFIGINAVVTKDVPEGKTVFGSRVIGSKETLDKIKDKLRKSDG